MIVPRGRLIWVMGVLLIPFAGLGATASDVAVLSWASIAAVLALVLLDGLLGMGALDGFSIEMPGVVRLLKDREGAIDLSIRNGKMTPRRVRLGLSLPRGLSSPDRVRVAAFPRGTELASLSWTCTGKRRGHYLLERCYLEGASPLGFWAVRSVSKANAEIRVYPNLMAERKNLASFFLKHGHFGSHAMRQVGRGREFEKLRAYCPGDSYDEIHWKATAKRRHPITKIFQVERTQEVYVMIDASRLSARNVPMPHRGRPPLKDRERFDQPRGSAAPLMETTLERFVNAALVLGMSAEQQGDLFGLMTFSNKVHGFLRAKNGKGHYSACRDTLYTLQPHVISPDFDDACSFIRTRLRRRALLIFLTALDDPVLAENFLRSVEVLSRQHLIMVSMLQPAGAGPLFAGSGVETVDDLYRALGGHIQLQNLHELGKVLRRHGAHFCLLDNERMTTQLVSQYVSLKQRQLL